MEALSSLLCESISPCIASARLFLSVLLIFRDQVALEP